MSSRANERIDWTNEKGEKILKVLLSHIGGCSVEAVDVNRGNGFCPLGKSWDPAEVAIVDGVYIDEDGSCPHNRVCPDEFEWGVGYCFAGRI